MDSKVILMKILEDEKDHMTILLEGIDQGYAHALAEKLLENKEITFASATYDHPTLRNPILTVRGKSLKKEIQKAIQALDENSDAFKQALAKI